MREVKPTQKPVPSSDIKDLFFNSGLLDIWATSLERKYIDRFGNCHLTAAGMEWIFNELIEKFNVDINQAIIAAGYITIDSFQQGADLPNNELTLRNHILRDETTGEYYRWDGDLPKQVPAGSTPQSTGGIGKGAWVSVGDASLRSDLIQNNGSDILYALSKAKYRRVGDFKRGATLNDETECLKFGNFYYAYAGSSEYPIVITENSEPDSSWVCVGDANMHHESHTIFNFGGKDDNGKTDNREAIQLAIEYMEFSGSRLLTNSTKDSKYFGVSSFHPDYPNEFCMVIKKPRSVNIFGGRNRNTSIKYTGSQSGKALIGIKTLESDWGMKIESLGAHAGFKLDHVLHGNDYWYAQNIFTGGCYEGALISGLKLSAYMSTFNRVFTTYTGDYGFEFTSPTTSPLQPATSLNISNCWARGAKINGFKVRCQLWYSSWTNNGCDGVTNHAEYAYCFDAATDGVTLESNGAETVKKYLYMEQPRGCRIAGIRCASMQPSDDSSLITFNSTTHVRLENLAPYGEASFTNQVEILSATGNEYISVDGTFDPEKLKVNKTSTFYRYPNIFYFDNNANIKTRGFPRMNGIIYCGEDEVYLSGFGMNDILEKNFKFYQSTSPVTGTLMRFSGTANVDVLFTIRGVGGGGVGYSSVNWFASWTLQNGIVLTNGTSSDICEITNNGTEILLTTKKNYYSLVVNCKILFRYDTSAGVLLSDSSAAFV